MISERFEIAQRFRSEGEGVSERIAGQRERDLNDIQSDAYRQAQQIRGEADAKATKIHARAYTQIAGRRVRRLPQDPGDLSENFMKDSTIALPTRQRHICPAKTRRHENKGLPHTA